MGVTVLRLGHRKGRDDRITTHVGLTARALGADQIILSGEKEESILDSWRDVTERWGGTFTAEYREDWRTVLKQWSGVSVHLTMYGLDFQEHVDDVKHTGENVLVVVGGEKVPRAVYNLADYNLAVGNQPHSEVAALAVFLYELNERRVKDVFEDAEITVEGTERGKELRQNTE